MDNEQAILKISEDNRSIVIATSAKLDPTIPHHVASTRRPDKRLVLSNIHRMDGLFLYVFTKSEPIEPSARGFITELAEAIEEIKKDNANVSATGDDNK